MTKILEIFGFVMFIASQCVLAQSVDGDTAEHQILKRQSARFVAMVDADVDTLEGLLADDLTYGHTRGSPETKSGFVETVRSARIDYLSFVPRGVKVRVYGETAVLNGFMDVEVIYKGENRKFTTVFLEVQHKVDGEWLLAAWQPVMF